VVAESAGILRKSGGEVVACYGDGPANRTGFDAKVGIGLTSDYQESGQG
jgi:hypothetical protein